MNNSIRLHYDEQADFFEILFGRPSRCRADEVEDGIFVRTDEETKKVKSIGILGFRERANVLDSIMAKLRLKVNVEKSS